MSQVGSPCSSQVTNHIRVVRVVTQEAILQTDLRVRIGRELARPVTIYRSNQGQSYDPTAISAVTGIIPGWKTLCDGTGCTSRLAVKRA
jgi:hypothetical protein